MRYALVKGERHEAQPDLLGTCPSCFSPMVAKCGQIRISHWAHSRKRTCDPWWENETEWHRAWKQQFPDDWQEVVHQAQNGEKHIADVKTDQGWVLEFQHSHIDPTERQARDAFYAKLVWVVDGTRRMRDWKQFCNALEHGHQVLPGIPLWTAWSGESPLLRDWSGSRAPVFFDFRKSANPENPRPMLWCLLSNRNDWAYLTRFLWVDFLRLHSPGANQEFSEILEALNKVISDEPARQEAARMAQLARQLPYQYGRRRGRL